MDYTSTGGHELEVTGLDGAFVACEVFMIDSAVEEISDRFLSSVWMIRETGTGRDGEMVLGIVLALSVTREK